LSDSCPFPRFPHPFVVLSPPPLDPFGDWEFWNLLRISHFFPPPVLHVRCHSYSNATNSRLLPTATSLRLLPWPFKLEALWVADTPIEVSPLSPHSSREKYLLRRRPRAPFPPLLVFYSLERHTETPLAPKWPTVSHTSFHVWTRVRHPHRITVSLSCSSRRHVLPFFPPHL